MIALPGARPSSACWPTFAWRRAFLLLVHQGLLLAAGGAGITSVAALLAVGHLSPPLGLVTFLVVYASYKIDHLADLEHLPEELRSARSRALARRSLHATGAGLAFVLALALAVSAGGWRAAAFLLLFPVSVVLYGTPLLGWAGGGRLPRRLKDVPYLKGFYTGLAWALLVPFTVVFLGAGHLGSLAVYAVFLVLRVFLSTVFCDLKDLARDRAEGVRTLPLALGLPQTLRLLSAVNLASIAVLGAAVAVALSPPWTVGLALVAPYCHRVLRCAGRPGADLTLLAEVAMDGELNLWLPAAALGWAVWPG